jgi:hypothetical protein
MSRADLRCAHPHWIYLVSPDKEFGGFCCKKCHLDYVNDKDGHDHGKLCERRKAPEGASRAQAVAPIKPLTEVRAGSASSSSHQADWSSASGGGRGGKWNGDEWRDTTVKQDPSQRSLNDKYQQGYGGSHTADWADYVHTRFPKSATRLLGASGGTYRGLHRWSLDWQSLHWATRSLARCDTTQF